MTTIDAVVKSWKKELKDSQNVLAGLEDEARQVAERQRYAADARSLIDDAVRGLETVQGDKASTETEMLTAMLTDDGEALEGLRERYASLTEREQALQGEIRQLSEVVEANTVDPSEVGALTTRLKRFRSPGVDDVVKAIRQLESSTTEATRSRVTATLEQLPTVDPRATHAALMQLDEGYRKNDGASLEAYIRDMDDKGNVQQATAMLAKRLEARERRAVIAAR